MESQLIPGVNPAHCIDGIPPSEILIPYPSIRSLLNSQARWQGDKTFLITFDEEGKKINTTFIQFYKDVSRTANFLRENNAQFGDRVLVNLGNDVDSLIQCFSVWMVGAGAVVLPENIPDEKAENFLKSVNCKTVFPTDTPFSELLKNHSDQFEIGKKSKLEDDVLIFVKQTDSGLKGVLLSHYNVLVTAMATADRLKLDGETTLFCGLPLLEVSGILGVVNSALYGGSPVFLSNTKNLTDAHILFTNFSELAKFAAEQGPNQLKHLNKIVCPNSTNTEINSDLIATELKSKMFMGLCLSETSGFSTLGQFKYDQSQQAITIGSSLRSNELDIHDGAGNSLPENEVGEIVIRGHSVMQGFVNDESAEKEMHQDGWFKTGLVGYSVREGDILSYYLITK
tara:strand:- start:17065 stop:18258 length:1194 start_codon:yes stop_codon:yes gene_type:complete